MRVEILFACLAGQSRYLVGKQNEVVSLARHLFWNSIVRSRMEFSEVSDLPCTTHGFTWFSATLPAHEQQWTIYLLL
jgi:hypothetical protein